MTVDEYVPPARPVNLTYGATWCACGVQWKGSRICHCPKCHRTFTGVEGFDAHRTGAAGPAEIFPDAEGRIRGRGGELPRPAELEVA